MVRSIATFPGQLPRSLPNFRPSAGRTDSDSPGIQAGEAVPVETVISAPVAPSLGNAGTPIPASAPIHRDIFASLTKPRFSDHAIQFLDSGRAALERVLYRVAVAAVPSLKIPDIMTPEIVRAVILSTIPDIDAEEIDEEDVEELSQDDYEVLPEDYRPRIEIPAIGYVYSSRDFVKFLKSPIICWLDRYDKALPGELPTDDEGNSSLEIFRQRGIEFEKAYWAGIKEEYAARGEADKVAEMPGFNDGRWRDYQEFADKAHARTLQAMREGKEWIYQGFLRSQDGHLEGTADLLRKVPNGPGETSAFGGYHYEPWELKLTKTPKVEHKLQLVLYVDLLEQMQGLRAEEFGIIAGDREKHVYKTDNHFDYYLRFKEMFFQYQADSKADLDKLPDIPKQANYGRYDRFLKREIKRRDALSQVAGLSNLHILRLRDAGIWTMSQLADSKLEKIDRVPEATFQRLKRQARVQAESRGRLELLELSAEEARFLRGRRIRYVTDLAEADDLEMTSGEIQDAIQRRVEAERAWREADLDAIRSDVEARAAAVREMAVSLKARAKAAVEALHLHKPKFEIIPPDPAKPGRGLAMLPPSSQNDIFFDIEGYMHEEANLEYLLGNTYIDYSEDPNGKLKFKDFWAHTWDEEKKSFEELIDWFNARRAEDPNMHIFHYASYEITAMRRLAAKYGTREKEVDALIKSDTFVDLYKVVKQGLAIGAPSYSLKKIEKLYMEGRTAEVVSALGSVDAYKDWLEAKDGDTWRTSKKLNDIREYNREDCESTLALARWLWDVQKENGVDWVDPAELRRVADEKRAERLKERDQKDKTWRQKEADEFRKRLDSARERMNALLDGHEWMPEQRRIMQLLTFLPDFHTREARPVFWALNHRHDMTMDELIEDADTLGGLSFTGESYHPTRDGAVFSSPAADLAVDAASSGAGDPPTEINLPHGNFALADDVPPYQPPNEHDPDKSSRSRSLVYTYRFDPASMPTVIADTKYEFVKEERFSGDVVAVDEDGDGVSVTIKAKPGDLSGAEAGAKYVFTRDGEKFDGEVNPLMGTARIRFKKSQDADLAVGDAAEFSFHQNLECHLLTIDRDKGVAEIKFGPKMLGVLGHEAPQNLNLSPKRQKSKVFVYDFDPAQDTKISAGDRCFFAHDLDVRCTVEKIDFKAGKAWVKIGPKFLRRLNGQVPADLALIPDEYVSARIMQESLLRIIERFLDEEHMIDGADGRKKRYLPPNSINLLRKSRPHIKGNPEGPVIPGKIWNELALKDPLQEGIFQAIKNLNDATLCIQGPPGTGKTFRAAKAIARLIKESHDAGREPPKIGIAAASHNSVANLMRMVDAECQKLGVEYRGIKVGKDPQDPLFDSENIEYGESAGAIVPALADVDVVGGTAWVFSHPSFEGEFDYLFIDEASQMPLSNGMAMAPSAKNVVMMGDQMQLPAPIQGAHPGESGMSLMDYYLNGAQVIPEDKGIFLDVTFRNPSAISNVFSGPVYQRKLRSAPTTEKQKVALPQDPDGIRYVGKEVGYVYVPVTQDRGNRRKSGEEAQVVADIVHELVGRDFTNWDNSTIPLTLDDIMIISPYVLQGKKIKELLGEYSDVGTVHKFQGREAPVTIISLAVGSSSPFSRSMDFWANLRMLNTAISRSRGLVVIVGSPELENIRVRTPEQMEMLNFYYKILRAAGWKGGSPDESYGAPEDSEEDAV